VTAYRRTPSSTTCVGLCRWRRAYAVISVQTSSNARLFWDRLLSHICTTTSVRKLL